MAVLEAGGATRAAGGIARRWIVWRGGGGMRAEVSPAISLRTRTHADVLFSADRMYMINNRTSLCLSPDLGDEGRASARRSLPLS